MTIDRDGFTTVADVLTSADIAALAATVAEPDVASIERAGSVFGGRNLLTSPIVREIARGDKLIRLLAPHIANPRPVRALFLDKTPAANWPVLWHQDLTIAVDRRHDIEGWGPWSVKAGVVHVEPPPSILERMLTIRLHLDDSHANNGPLRVLPGTHRLGRLKRDQIADLRREIAEAICVAAAGAALLVRPLLLHASSPATKPSRRRVIQIEYAPADSLPPPLRWAN